MKPDLYGPYLEDWAGFSASFRGGFVEAIEGLRIEPTKEKFSASFRGGFVEASTSPSESRSRARVLRLVQRRLR